MIFLLALWLGVLPAQATTFGPFPLVGQIENSPYVVRGRASARRVEMDRGTQRPHTYWNFQVIEQMRGDPLGDRVVLRQPGGEIGEIGYHVSGVANFRDGDEVVVMLRGTAETGIYDVVGLSAGKYTVRAGKLENSLGFTATDARGLPLGLDEFRALVNRVNSRDSTPEDRAIIFNRGGSHSHDDHSRESPTTPVENSLESSPENTGKTHESGPKSVQPTAEVTDEPSKGQSGSWRWIFLLGGGSALVAAWLILKR